LRVEYGLLLLRQRGRVIMVPPRDKIATMWFAWKVLPIRSVIIEYNRRIAMVPVPPTIFKTRVLRQAERKRAARESYAT